MTTVQDVLQFLKQHPEGCSCTEVGEHFWGGLRTRQAYARPAGKILARAVREGKAAMRWVPVMLGGKRPRQVHRRLFFALSVGR